MGTLKTVDDELIAKVRDRLLAACRPEQIIVFGSTARAQVRRGSDLDLLIVMELPDGTTPREMARRLHALFEGWRLPIDLIVLTPEAYRWGVRMPGHIASIADREGDLIYG